MKKFFVVITGIYLLLLALLSGALGVSGFLVPPEVQEAQSASPLTVFCVFMPVMVWLAATGVGLFMRKNWARLSLLVMSGLALFSGVTSMAAIALMPFPDTGLDADAVGAIKAIIVGVMGFFLVVLPVTYGIFFTRKSVKTLFGNPDENQSKSKRPVGITILALFTVVGAVGSVASLFTSGASGIPFFGLTLTGTAMKGYMLFIAYINLYLAYGYWKLQKQAWIAGVAIYVFGIVHTLFNVLFMKLEDFLAVMPLQDPAYVMNPIFFKGMMLTSMVAAAGMLGYLILKKPVFHRVEALELEEAIH